MDEPIVYFKPGCPFGIRLRTALTLHRVPHRSVRFRDDEEAAVRVRDVNGGNEISPTVQVASQWLTNPTWREVRDATSSMRHRADPDPHKDPVVEAREPARREAAESEASHRAAPLTWLSAAVVATTTSILLAGCSAAPDERASVVTTPEPAAASPLEGVWRAGPISLEETAATVRSHGLGQWVEDYRANAPFARDTVLTLTIENGQWDLYGESGGGQPEPIDYDAEYEIDGDSVTFHHSDGSITYRWAVVGDMLDLELVRSTLPAYQGIPDEVFQRALYMTEAFRREADAQ